jgi:hypothetical protein
MTTEPPKMSLLEELDARQDALLADLDQLNQQIERVIGEWTSWHASQNGDRSLPAAA